MSFDYFSVSGYDLFFYRFEFLFFEHKQNVECIRILTLILVYSTVSLLTETVLQSSELNFTT